jgi:hypothetical protein
MARRVFLQTDSTIGDGSDSGGAFYFPIDSLMATWERVESSEREACVLLAGRYGISGIRPGLGLTRPWRIGVLCSGWAWRLPVESLERDSRTAATVQRQLVRFLCAVTSVHAFQATCDAEHNVRQRVAGWLLRLSSDLGRTDVAMTHEAFARLISIRRPSVSSAVSWLQRSGSIRSYHGRIVIVDPQALAEDACGCWRAAIAAYGQDVSCDGQIISSRTSQPGGCESAKTTARATLSGALRAASGPG